MDITFSRSVSWHFDSDSISFHAVADTKRITCIVSQEFLTAPVVRLLSEPEALELFKTRRSEIESIIRKRIEKNAFDSPGKIVIKTK